MYVQICTESLRHLLLTVTTRFLQRKLSVDDVMQDLQLEDSFEQAPNERAVIPRSVTYDVGHTGTNDEPSEVGASK